jgi:hypothetical protein
MDCVEKDYCSLLFVAGRIGLIVFAERALSEWPSSHYFICALPENGQWCHLCHHPFVMKKMLD